MNSETGKWIMIAGGVILAAGMVIYFFHDKLNWFGNLPGDIRIEKENGSFYFPIVTCILVSVIISVVSYIIRKYF